MKISRVTAHVLRVPYSLPLIAATQHAAGTFVEIETDDGLLGHAFSTQPMAFGVADFIRRDVGTALIGMDPLRPEAVRSVLYHGLGEKIVVGAWACAASLVDIALWDIRGKALAQPIWKLLGGARDRCPVYVTFGLPSYGREELVEAARIQIRDGHTQLKMAVGEGAAADPSRDGQPTDEDIVEDAARVRSLRESLGDGVTLMIDANKKPRFTQAVHLARLVEPYEVAWFEDPLVQGDPRLLAQLRRRTSIPIAAGSTGTYDITILREYLVQEALDIAQPNVRDIGGFTGGLRAAALAQAFNIPLEMGGNFPRLNMHLHAGVPNGGRVEFNVAGWQIEDALFDHTPRPVSGWVALPEKPGLGYTPKAGILDLVVH